MRDPDILPIDVDGGMETTPLKAWQLSRDLVIVAAHNAGASPKLLAEVFGLKTRRVQLIIEETRKRYEDDPSRRTARLPANPRRFVA